MTRELRNHFRDPAPTASVAAAVRLRDRVRIAITAKLQQMPHDDLARVAGLLLLENLEREGALRLPKKRGRPPKPPKKAETPKRLRGRPRDMKRLTSLEGLLATVVRECAEANLSGRGAVTKALWRRVRHWGPRWTIAKQRRDVSAAQKAVAEAKRLFPEIASKLPK